MVAKPNKRYGWSQSIADDLARRETIVAQTEVAITYDQPHDEQCEDIVVMQFDQSKQKPSVCGIKAHMLDHPGYSVGYEFMALYDKHRWSRTSEQRELDADNQAIEVERRKVHDWARDVWRNREPWDKRTEQEVIHQCEERRGFGRLNPVDQPPAPFRLGDADHVPDSHFWILSTA